MTLVTDPGVYPQFAGRLDAEGIPHIDERTAAEQEMHTLNSGLANLMPAAAMKATELQWYRWFGGHSLVQIRPYFVKFDDDRREREGASRSRILSRYTPLSALREGGLDTLVVTGDNLETREKGFSAGREALELEDITYKEQLEELIAFSEEVPVTIFSCLAAHFALHYRHGLDRKILDEKVMGVFSHDVADGSDPLMRGMGDSMVSPHSRWGDTSIEEVGKVRELKVLAASERVGWLVLQEELPNGNLRIYLQGHPEYDKHDLDAEYKRDRETDGVSLPHGYYPDDDCSQTPNCNWPPYARVLHENILGETYRIAEARRHLQAKPHDSET
jgi:homoserine O-succinyltransferase